MFFICYIFPVYLLRNKLLDVSVMRYNSNGQCQNHRASMMSTKSTDERASPSTQSTPTSPPPIPFPVPVPTEDYFSPKKTLRRTKRFTAVSPLAPSPSSIDTRLAYQLDPNVTFDSMLTVHVSGKGEAYRGAENAKKDEAESPGQRRRRNYMVLRGRKSESGSPME